VVGLCAHGASGGASERSGGLLPAGLSGAAPRDEGEQHIYLVIVMDGEGENVPGLVTLHDLLRAEVEKARASEE
jgi:hypothetical protein